MKKPLYITVLTAFVLAFYLPNIVDLNFLFIPLIWLVDIALLFVGELVGTRVGRRSRFGEKYGANIGASISSAVILAFYAFWVIIIPSEGRANAMTVLYYPIGAAGVRSLIINAGNIAAKKIVTFYARHGAPPSPDLTLKKFLPRLLAAAGTAVVCAASIVIFFLLAQYEEIAFRLITEALNAALHLQIAFLIGKFIERLTQKPLAVNIAIAAMTVWCVIPRVRFFLNDTMAGYFFPGLMKTEMTVGMVMIVFWAVVLIADVVWAALKIRKSKAKTDVKTG